MFDRKAKTQELQLLESTRQLLYRKYSTVEKNKTIGERFLDGSIFANPLDPDLQALNRNSDYVFFPLLEPEGGKKIVSKSSARAMKNFALYVIQFLSESQLFQLNEALFEIELSQKRQMAFSENSLAKIFVLEEIKRHKHQNLQEHDEDVIPSVFKRHILNQILNTDVHKWMFPKGESKEEKLGNFVKFNFDADKEKYHEEAGKQGKDIEKTPLKKLDTLRIYDLIASYQEKEEDKLSDEGFTLNPEKELHEVKNKKVKISRDLVQIFDQFYHDNQPWLFYHQSSATKNLFKELNAADADEERGAILCRYLKEPTNEHRRACTIFNDKFGKHINLEEKTDYSQDPQKFKL